MTIRRRTNQRHVPFEWNGITQYSVKLFADKRGVTIDTVYRWLRKGYNCDSDLRPVGRPPENEFNPSHTMPKVLPPLRKFGKVKRIIKIRSKIQPFGED